MAADASGRRHAVIVAHEVRAAGGMELAMLKLVEALARVCDEVHVVSRSCECDEPAVVFHRVGTPERPFLLGFPLFAVAGALRLRQIRRPGDLVIALGAIVPSRVDVTVVQFCHSGYRRRAPGIRRSGGSLVRHAYAAASASMSRGAERWCYRRSRMSSFVAVSHALAQEMRETFPVAELRWEVIPNGVDAGRYAVPAAAGAAVRRELAIPDDALLAIFVGGDWERKRLASAIEALSGMEDWWLLVVGWGDIDGYRRRAEEFGVAARVVFAGVRRDVERCMAAADAFVFPSAYEGLALVTAEAAAAGLPLVVTEATGALDFAEAGRAALVVDGTAPVIRQALKRLAAADERARFGAAALEASRGVTWESIQRRYLAALQRLAA